MKSDIFWWRWLQIIGVWYILYYMCVGGIYTVIRFAAIDHILIPKWYRLSSGKCALLLIHNDVSVELSDDKFYYVLKTKVYKENMLLIHF
jgi:hypothetical protein